jgi:hypothetical protein
MAARILSFLRVWVVRHHRLLFSVLAALNLWSSLTIYHEHPYVASLNAAMGLILILVAAYL